MFIEKGPTDCWPWQLNPDDAPNKGALMACRNQKCCNPRHVVSRETFTQEEIKDAVLEIDEKEQLKAILDAHEIEYRKNASLESLQELVNGI